MAISGCLMVVPGMEFFSHSIGLSPSFSTPSADCNDQAENKIKYYKIIFKEDKFYVTKEAF